MRFSLVLVGLTLLCACAIDDSIEDRRSGQQLVCHKGHTQAVTSADFMAHLDHGDSVGPCPTEL